MGYHNTNKQQHPPNTATQQAGLTVRPGCTPKGTPQLHRRHPATASKLVIAAVRKRIARANSPLSQTVCRREQKHAVHTRGHIPQRFAFSTKAGPERPTATRSAATRGANARNTPKCSMVSSSKKGNQGDSTQHPLQNGQHRQDRMPKVLSNKAKNGNGPNSLSSMVISSQRKLGPKQRLGQQHHRA